MFVEEELVSDDGSKDYDAHPEGSHEDEDVEEAALSLGGSWRAERPGWRGRPSTSAVSGCRSRSIPVVGSVDAFDRVVAREVCYIFPFDVAHRGHGSVAMKSKTASMVVATMKDRPRKRRNFAQSCRVGAERVGASKSQLRNAAAGVLPDGGRPDLRNDLLRDGV